MEQDYTWEYNPPDANQDPIWEQEVFRTLYTTCLKASNDLWRLETAEFLSLKTIKERDEYREKATALNDPAVITADSATVAAFQSLNDFTSVGNIDMTQDIHTVGTLGRFLVKRNIKLLENQVEVKWRGKTAIVHVKGLDKSSVM